jgi:hypothetical protein
MVQIVDAAERLFKRDGFHATSVDAADGDLPGHHAAGLEPEWTNDLPCHSRHDARLSTAGHERHHVQPPAVEAVRPPRAVCAAFPRPEVRPGVVVTRQFHMTRATAEVAHFVNQQPEVHHELHPITIRPLHERRARQQPPASLA